MESKARETEFQFQDMARTVAQFEREDRLAELRQQERSTHTIEIINEFTIFKIICCKYSDSSVILRQTTRRVNIENTILVPQYWLEQNLCACVAYS